MGSADGGDASRRLDELEALVQRLRRDLEDLASLQVSEPAGGSPGVSGPQEEPRRSPVFPAADAWVQEFLLPTFQRPFGGELRWCSEWKTHPEAVLRLEAMWRAWEMLTAEDGLGLSVWLLSHFDPSFSVLTSRSGPFARCALDRHSS